MSRDLLKADPEDLDNLSASEVQVKRFKHQEVSHDDAHHFHVWTVHPMTETLCETNGDNLRRRNGKSLWSVSGD